MAASFTVAPLASISSMIITSFWKNIEWSVSTHPTISIFWPSLFLVRDVYGQCNKLANFCALSLLPASGDTTNKLCALLFVKI